MIDVMLCMKYHHLNSDIISSIGFACFGFGSSKADNLLTLEIISGCSVPSKSKRAFSLGIKNCSKHCLEKTVVFIINSASVIQFDIGVLLQGTCS